MKTRMLTLIAGAAALALSTGAVAGNHGGYGHAKSNTIVDVARDAGQFNTLLTAVEAAGLTGALSGEGPFTVFAPTDEAFAAIPADQLQAILADREQLTAILTYHVVSGKVTSSDVVGLSSATTLQGSDIAITVNNGSVRVDEANVVTVDIEASNGVIHVIDAVITP